MDLIKIFHEYVSNNYDLNSKLIKEKYEHSIRVYFLMMKLGEELKLPSEDIRLAMIIGLFHDIGRFEQVVRFEKLADRDPFDHGSYGVHILFDEGLIKEFDLSSEDEEIVRNAVFYHNKNKIGEEVNDRGQLFAKMIRDMDKIDIMFVFNTGYKLKYDRLPNEQLLEDFYNGRECDIHYLKGDSDRIIYYLGWLNDLYFKESHLILSQTRYFQRVFNTSPYLTPRKAKRNYMSAFVKGINVQKEYRDCFDNMADVAFENEKVRRI